MEETFIDGILPSCLRGDWRLYDDTAPDHRDNTRGLSLTNTGNERADEVNQIYCGAVSFSPRKLIPNLRAASRSYLE